ncbi:sugar nucleotide-binding protein [Patescibacteria group bacterium]|nr:sugar nucleotide-binding protein [Patescibacteria group bacterium]
MNSYSIYNKTILMSGGSGSLGTKLAGSLKEFRLLAPPHKELDIASYETIDNYMRAHKLKNIIFLNCAAIIGEREAVENPEKLYLTNIKGVQNVKKACLKYNCFLLQISTDYIFNGKRGRYKENDYPYPVTQYGWTKLIAEELIKEMDNSLILRLNFVDPENLRFPKALVDQYSSRDLISNTCKDIRLILLAINKGVKLPKILHIGSERRSQYEFYRTFAPNIEKKSLKEIPFPLPKDTSFDISLWKKIKSDLLRNFK